jgi:archaemetzincin
MPHTTNLFFLVRFLFCFGSVLWHAALLNAIGPAWPWPLDPEDRAALPEEFRRLIPLHTRLQKPQPGDWLDKHFEEGQSYRAYLACNPIRMTRERNTLWIHPLGKFSPAERNLVNVASEFLGDFYQIPVKTSEDWPLSLVPEKATHKQGDRVQIQSIYILDEIMPARLPENAFASLAFTTSDLWPGKGWNFVYGQASLQERVGIWSIHRFGNPEGDAAALKLMLRRTLKTAVHETGHMFSMQHCVYYECVMNGSNHLEEADRQPLWLCPECSAKLHYATGTEPRLHFEHLIQFAAQHDFTTEKEMWERSLKILQAQ